MTFTEVLSHLCNGLPIYREGWADCNTNLGELNDNRRD
jgi:hypothetical protein